MSRTYKHSPVIHFFGLGGTVFFFWMLTLACRADLGRVSNSFRLVLIAATTILGLGSLLLYLTSGLNRYEVTRQGLHVHRFLGSTFHPWTEVTRIDYNQPLRFIIIRGNKGRIAYSSTDCFPQLIRLIQSIHERSNCTLPPVLMGIMVS